MSIKQEKPVMLMILDGWGIGSKDDKNAIYKAATPNLDMLFESYASTVIHAASEAVGLPPQTMGNSEVGHINIGAGRTVYQSLMKINVAIENGEFFKNEQFLKAIENAKASKSALHLMGLVSDGPVHSYITHLHALVKLARQEGLEKIYIHAFMDGRDTPPDSGKMYMQNLLEFLQKEGVGQVATISGRYWAMDRDKNYDRVKRVYEAMAEGKGNKYKNPVAAIEASYQKGADHFDEFIEPIVIVDDSGEPLTTIKDNDSVIFFNFRPDRAKQMAYAWSEKDFGGFEKSVSPKILFVKMTQYAEDLSEHVAFGPTRLENTLGEVLAKNKIPQLRIAETEKYAHVTHFFNGGSDEVFELEERKLIPSPKDVEGKYDRKPEMSAYTITDELLLLLDSKKFKVIVLNFANCDMVGHTGDMEAAIKAMEAVDYNVGRIVENVLDKNGTVLITADHGNAEEMLNEQGKKVTQHSLNDVPCIFVNKDMRKAKLREGTLGDIAPTILDLLNIEKPSEMTGQSIIQK